MLPTAPRLSPPPILPAFKVFTAFAGHGRRGFEAAPVWAAVLVGWGMPPENRLAVPANRMGHGIHSAAEPKTMQDVITLAVLAAPAPCLGGALTWNGAAGAPFVFRAPLGWARPRRGHIGRRAWGAARAGGFPAAAHDPPYVCRYGHASHSRWT